MNNKRRPLLGYVDKTKLSKRAFGAQTVFCCLVAVMQFQNSWRLRHDIPSLFMCVLDFASALAFVFLALHFWRMWIAARTPDWQGDRWLQPRLSQQRHSESDVL